MGWVDEGRADGEVGYIDGLVDRIVDSRAVELIADGTASQPARGEQDKHNAEYIAKKGIFHRSTKLQLSSEIVLKIH